jgi:aromatic ring-opening dioxygenase catalytic subunit (LigB family)
MVVMKDLRGLPPVLLLSHGTTMLTGEQSNVRDYWKYHGDKALEHPIKGIIMMVSIPCREDDGDCEE